MISYLINASTREVIEEIGDGDALEAWVTKNAETMKIDDPAADNSTVACVDRLSQFLKAGGVGIRMVGAVVVADTGEPVVEDFTLAPSIHSDWELVDIS